MALENDIKEKMSDIKRLVSEIDDLLKSIETPSNDIEDRYHGYRFYLAIVDDKSEHSHRYYYPLGLMSIYDARRLLTDVLAFENIQTKKTEIIEIPRHQYYEYSDLIRLQNTHKALTMLYSDIYSYRNDLLYHWINHLNKEIDQTRKSLGLEQEWEIVIETPRYDLYD